MGKEKVEHTDILGQPLKEGNYVATSRKNTMHICRIIKVSPKMIRVIPIKGVYSGDNGWLVWADQSVLLSGPDALAYILTHAGN
jgi:hypothetical protein